MIQSIVFGSVVLSIDFYGNISPGFDSGISGGNARQGYEKSEKIAG